MSNRFSYIAYDLPSQAKQQAIKAAFEHLEGLVEAALPETGRSKALVMTHLEEAYMWVGKGIRDNQLIRMKAEKAAEQVERGNG